ncbi:MAG: UPF0146 family protein [Methanoregula sp.]
MEPYKHIETSVGRYIAGHYASPVEVGVGRNPGAAAILHAAGIPIRCTDIRSFGIPAGIVFTVDDIFEPDLSFYNGADVIYAIRPAIEMIPPLIDLATRIGCDLVVYHLGFEIYGNGGESIDCGVLLHRYVRGSETVKQG